VMPKQDIDGKALRTIAMYLYGGVSSE